MISKHTMLPLSRLSALPAQAGTVALRVPSTSLACEGTQILAREGRQDGEPEAPRLGSSRRVKGSAWKQGSSDQRRRRRACEASQRSTPLSERRRDVVAVLATRIRRPLFAAALRATRRPPPSPRTRSNGFVVPLVSQARLAFGRGSKDGPPTIADSWASSVVVLDAPQMVWTPCRMLWSPLS